MNMETNLLQRARDIAAETYIRLEMKQPTQGHTAQDWADHIQSFAQFTREGAYDSQREVQIALAALRSITPPALSEAEMAQLVAEDEAAERRIEVWERAKRLAADHGGKA